jgi:hypothetical protein
MFACCRPSGPPSVANCGNCDGRLGYQAFSPSRAKKDEPNGHQEEPSGRPLRPKDHESSELLRVLTGSLGRRIPPQGAQGKSTRDDPGQQPLVLDDPLSVLSHLLDSGEVRDELSEEEICADEQTAGPQEPEEVIESDWHLFRISVGEDQIVRPVEPGQEVGGAAADDTDAMAVPRTCDLKLGKACVFGVAFDRLDERARTVSEAERRIAKATSDFENPLSPNRGRKNSEKRAARGRVHAASRAVFLPMLMRGAANPLERVALTLSRVDPRGYGLRRRRLVHLTSSA